MEIRLTTKSSASSWLVMGMLFVLAVLFGLVATTADPVLVGLGIGLLVGGLLLASPTWNIWIVLVSGLFVAGLLPLWVEGHASKAAWGISVLGLLLLMRSWLQILAAPKYADRTPAFVWATMAFILYVGLNGLIQADSAFGYLGGLKRYFQVSGVMFALVWLAIDDRTIARYRRLFLILAITQLPWAIYQYIWIVPIREGLQYAYPGLVPIDVVAGSFGAYIKSGGANAEMATFLIITLGFILARSREKALPFGAVVILCPIILAPLLIGETKIVVVFLPLLFLTLYRREVFARPHKALLGLLTGALLTIGAFAAYVEVTKQPLDKLVADTARYNMYEQGYGGYALNRTTALTFWARGQGLHAPTRFVFGHGLSAAHDPTGGKIARQHPGYGVGLSAASALLWEQGILGVILILVVLGLAWQAASRVRRASTKPWARADAAAIQATLPIFALYLPYRTALIDSLPFQIVFYTLLGYLAWLARRESGR